MRRPPFRRLLGRAATHCLELLAKIFGLSHFILPVVALIHFSFCFALINPRRISDARDEIKNREAK